MTNLWLTLLSFALNLQSLNVHAQIAPSVSVAARPSPASAVAAIPAPALALAGRPAQAASPSTPSPTVTTVNVPAPTTGTPAFSQVVGAGRTSLLDMPVNIRRIAIANPDLAETTVVNPREVMINGKKAGTTSLVLWLGDGSRLVYTLTVTPDDSRIEAVRRELHKNLPGEDMEVGYENDTVFLRGTAANLIDADRAVAIAATMGPVVNLLSVSVPPVQRQILLKVRFADVDRTVSSDLGVNFFSTGVGGGLGTPGSVGTGQYTAPALSTTPSGTTVSLGDALNLFLFNPALNMGATIKALQSKALLEILAEPNVLAIDGKPASFLSGGEFPYPTLQGGGGGLGAVTISFREFGIRINFLPRVTPRGTIRLQLAPEVSSLDFANGLVFQGFTIPALATRRVQTEVELKDGQSFAIAGLLNNQVTETLNKIPGLGDIPLLGKIFQSRARSKNNSELLIIVTPEIIEPIPVGMPTPEVKMPQEFLGGTAKTSPRSPGIDKTGETLPRSGLSVTYEQMAREQKVSQGTTPSGGQGAAQPVLQFVPMLTQPGSGTPTGASGEAAGAAPPAKSQ